MYWTEYRQFFRRVFANDRGHQQEERQSGNMTVIGPKYRSMIFELRVYRSDHCPDMDTLYTSPELTVPSSATVTEVVEQLCTSVCVEYDPGLYGLYFHDDTALPLDVSLLDYLDRVHANGYHQDSLVLHMIHKTIQVSFPEVDESVISLSIDFSQPIQFLHGVLCRRYGVRYHSQYILQYEGEVVELTKSLLYYGVREEEHIVLARDPTATDEEEIGEITSMILDNDNIQASGGNCDGGITVNLEKGIVAGTFDQLLNHITAESDPDMDLVKTILYSYQLYATPELLLNKFIERYNVAHPPGMSLEGFGVMKQTIQSRVINALRLWLDLGVDFKESSSLQASLILFMNTVLVMDYPKLTKTLKVQVLLIKGVLHERSMETSRGPSPPVKIPAHISLSYSVFDFHPEEVARQMTVIDFRLFVKIKPAEILYLAWQKPKYKHRAENMRALLHRLNSLTHWVSTTIISQKKAKSRAMGISYFATVAQHLLDMHNYAILVALVGGLEDPSIRRLKHTLRRLDQATVERLEALREVISADNHCRRLRVANKIGASKPSIPFLGLYTSELATAYAMPSYSRSGHINLRKCNLIYRQIRDMLLRQDNPYNYEEVPAITRKLTQLPHLDSETLYEVSLLREPRDNSKK